MGKFTDRPLIMAECEDDPGYYHLYWSEYPTHLSWDEPIETQHVIADCMKEEYAKLFAAAPDGYELLKKVDAEMEICAFCNACDDCEASCEDCDGHTDNCELAAYFKKVEG